MTLGYDIGTRVVMAMGGAAFSYESSLATHSIAGTFGAAAAAACAAGLDARQMRWALDYTAQQSSGIIAWRRDTDHIEKAFVFAGMPARNGVTSALLVQSGWNGVDDIFSGADNFFVAYAPKAQPDRLIEKLGERYEIAQTDIKKWTVGSPIQGPLDAIEAIRGKKPFEADQVQARDRAPRPVGRSGGGQPRHPRHLPAAHGRRDAARQDRLVPCARTTSRACRTRPPCASAPR